MILLGGFHFPDDERHFLQFGESAADYRQMQRDRAYARVRNWSVAVDIGAHVGLFSSDFARRFESVIAFEPVPQLRDCLRWNAPENVEILSTACGAASRLGQMVVHPGRWGQSHLAHTLDFGDEQIEVQVRTLDSFNLQDVGLMKVDVSGAEVEVLQGAVETLTRCHPVVLLPAGADPDLIRAADSLLGQLGYGSEGGAGEERIYYWIDADATAEPVAEQVRPDLILDFSPAVVAEASPPAEITAVRIPAPMANGAIRVGWLLLTKDVQAASVRYRCYHMAQALSGMDMDHVYFTDPGALGAELKNLDAIIIVKRLDTDLLKLAAEARAAKKAVFLDLCDDLLSARYSKNRNGLYQVTLAGLAACLDGIVVPSPAMADRVRDYLAEISTRQVAVHVIPDIAEGPDLYQRVVTFVSGETAPAFSLPAAPKPPETGQPWQVLWFGNFGAPHSNFGISSLLPAMKALCAAHAETPLELVVVSNNEAIFNALIAPAGVPCRYVPWSPEHAYEELGKAHVALLTNGDDEFCTIKSSNRTLQALAIGVPVIAPASSALTEFSDIVLSRVDKGLSVFLGPGREDFLQANRAKTEQILARYRPNALAGLWNHLLRRTIAAHRTPPAEGAPRLLIVVEQGGQAGKLKSLLAFCAKNGLSFELLVSLSAFEASPAIVEALIATRVSPSLLVNDKGMYPQRLAGITHLVLEDKRGPQSDKLAGWAKERGCIVTGWKSLSQGELAGPRGRDGSAAAPAGKQPGPFPERLSADGTADWAFVTHPNSRGWILDAICREIGSRQPGSWTMLYETKDLPVMARNYFFAHHSLYVGHFRRNRDKLEGRGTFIWYTHPRSLTPEEEQEMLEAFSQATKVIFTCEANREVWLGKGLASERTVVVLGGADADFFAGHRRGGGVVGLSSSFYERKNPDCLLELIQRMPHRQFCLLGRKWEEYALFEQMKAAPNFHYVSAPYEDYPDIYRTFDVFLSMSSLEGGPIPLLEAMMENAVPVASDTGFAPDLIRHGENGFLFDPEAPATEIVPLIEAAFALTTDIRSTVLPYDWESFSRQIVSMGH